MANGECFFSFFIRLTSRHNVASSQKSFFGRKIGSLLLSCVFEEGQKGTQLCKRPTSQVSLCKSTRQSTHSGKGKVDTVGLAKKCLELDKNISRALHNVQNTFPNLRTIKNSSFERNEYFLSMRICLSAFTKGLVLISFLFLLLLLFLTVVNDLMTVLFVSFIDQVLCQN